MKIEIRHLRIIQEVARTGSLTQAAEAMNITQPALSHYLKQMEEIAGAQFFNRANRMMKINPVGRLLLEASHELLPRISQYENKLEDMVRGENVNIKLSTECHTSYYWLPQIIRDFKKDNLDTSIDIVAEATRNPIDFLSRGLIDLAIVNEPNDYSNHKIFVQEPLFKDEVVLLVSKDSPLANKRVADLEDFECFPFIMYAEEFGENFLAKSLLIPAAVKPQNIIKMQLTEAIVEMVKNDLGIAALSHWASKPYIENKEVVPLKMTADGLYRQWKAVYLKSSMIATTIDKFIYYMKNAHG